MKLTPEEHYVAHQLLVKIHPTNYKLVTAAFCMTFDKDGKRSNNKLYGWLRREYSIAKSISMKLFWEEKTEEERKIFSEKMSMSFANKSEDEKIARMIKIMNTKNSIPEEDRLENLKRQSEGVSKQYAERSEEDKQARGEKIKVSHSKRTPEEKQQRIDRRLATTAAKSPEERAASLVKRTASRRNKSPEELAAFSEKLSTSIKQSWIKRRLDKEGKI